MSNYAVLVIANDGQTDLIGPYTSERRARRDADLIMGQPWREDGASADVYLMDRVRNAWEYYAPDGEDS